MHVCLSRAAPALMLVTLFGISIVIFFLLRVVPGNIVDILFAAAGYVDPADKANLEKELGIDQPLVGAVSALDQRLPARRFRLFLCLGEAGAPGDPAADPDHRAARRPGAVVLGLDRHSAGRHQRGEAGNAARLRVARGQPQRLVAALVLARPADPHRSVAMFNQMPIFNPNPETWRRRSRPMPCRPPPSASAARR